MSLLLPRVGNTPGLCCILLPLPPSLSEPQNSHAKGTQEVGQAPDLPRKSYSQSALQILHRNGRRGPVCPAAGKQGSSQPSPHHDLTCADRGALPVRQTTPHPTCQACTGTTALPGPLCPLFSESEQVVGPSGPGPSIQRAILVHTGLVSNHAQLCRG